MENQSKKDKNKLADELLHRTARSFYLTLHVLPQPIRFPISLAYLFARSTDTVADVGDWQAQQRLLVLNQMLDLINHGNNLEKILKLQTSFSAFATFSNEFILLNHFKQLIDWLYELDESTRVEIVKLINQIVQGQQLDIERFQMQKNISCLRSIAELDQYTYSVAGCVGEFWTNICLKKLKNYSNKPTDELYPLAISFGKGLQLVNILRDIPKDIEHGRCYLPIDQLKKYAINLPDLTMHIERLDPIVQYWWQKAVDHLRDGWNYMLSINQRRTRAAIALPLLLGFATLYKLKDTSYLTQNKVVKVSRKQVKLCMFIATLSMISTKFFALTRFIKFHNLIKGVQ